MRERADELAWLVRNEMGAPISLARQLHVATPIVVFDAHVGLADSYEFEREEYGALIALETAGVAAAITPWNVSLFLTACKVAPAFGGGMRRRAEAE